MSSTEELFVVRVFGGRQLIAHQFGADDARTLGVCCTLVTKHATPSGEIILARYFIISLTLALAADEFTRRRLTKNASHCVLCELLCRGSHMATDLSIEPELLNRALEVSGERTKKAAVTKALQEFVARREQQEIEKLFGTLDWNPDFNYRSERSRQ